MSAARLVAVAPAKVNLGLQVLGRRPDGYHDILSVMQAITLYDALEWTATGAPFDYVGPPGVPRELDLFWRALGADPERERWTGRLTLRKRIPLAAGLGGGSADAALALRVALPEASDADLLPLAARLGADVPFFLRGGTALARGLGDDLEQLPTPRAWFVLLTPPLAMADKTRALYRGLGAADFGDGADVRAVAAALTSGAPPLDALPNAFARQLDALPVVRYARTMLVRAGARHVNISGAGPTLFAAFPSYSAAARVASLLPADAGRATLARAAGPLDWGAARRIAGAIRGRMKP